jgi:hypothetical protein
MGEKFYVICFSEKIVLFISHSLKKSSVFIKLEIVATCDMINDGQMIDEPVTVLVYRGKH